MIRIFLSIIISCNISHKISYKQNLFVGTKTRTEERY